MMLIAWSAATLLAVIGFASAPGDPVPFKTLDSGDQSGVETRREVAVRTAAEWTALWKQHAADRPRPGVDVTRSTVLGIFLGSRPSAGFSVAIDSVDRQGAELVVTYRERRPNPADMVAQMLTAPYVLVTIERFDGKVRFVRAP
jgi:hypothetical protein